MRKKTRKKVKRSEQKDIGHDGVPRNMTMVTSFLEDSLQSRAIDSKFPVDVAHKRAMAHFQSGTACERQEEMVERRRKGRIVDLYPR